MVAHVYGLFDPIDGALRYVGHTRQKLAERLSGHVQDPCNESLAEWLRGLARKGLRPLIERIETVASRMALDAEARAILRYSDCDLLNIQKHRR